jgi:hypothetical protein
MTKTVTPEVAEQCFRLALQAGPVPRPLCTQATSRILGQLPGFEPIDTVLLPDNLHDRFATLSGVETVERREADDGFDRTVEIERFEASGAVSSTP